MSAVLFVGQASDLYSLDWLPSGISSWIHGLRWWEAALYALIPGAFLAFHQVRTERNNLMVFRNPPNFPSSTNTFSLPGQAFVEVGRLRQVFSARSSIVGVRAAVNVPPTGSPLIVDVNKNGTTIFTDQRQRPAIAPGSNASAEMTPTVSALEAGDHLTIDVDQVGSELPGGDLTVMVRWREVVN